MRGGGRSGSRQSVNFSIYDIIQEDQSALPHNTQYTYMSDIDRQRALQRNVRFEQWINDHVCMEDLNGRLKFYATNGGKVECGLRAIIRHVAQDSRFRDFPTYEDAITFAVNGFICRIYPDVGQYERNILRFTHEYRSASCELRNMISVELELWKRLMLQAPVVRMMHKSDFEPKSVIIVEARGTVSKDEYTVRNRCLMDDFVNLDLSYRHPCDIGSPLRASLVAILLALRYVFTYCGPKVIPVIYTTSALATQVLTDRGYVMTPPSPAEFCLDIMNEILLISRHFSQVRIFTQ